MMTIAPLLFSLLLVGTGHLAQAKDYVAEVFFVVDPKVVSNYLSLGYDKPAAIQTIRDDANFMVYEVNKYFKTMGRYGLNLEIRMKKLDILNVQLLTPCKLLNKADIHGDMGVEVFQGWLKSQGLFQKVRYDIAILWTGFGVIGSSGHKGEGGYAITPGVCSQEKGVGIVKFDGTQNTAQTTAHEIAHSLGAAHDSTVQCNPIDGYIMSPVIRPNVTHRWEFSTCSIFNIMQHMNDLDAAGTNCMSKSMTTTSDPGFQLSSQKGRDIMDPQKVCQRSQNLKESYFCSYTFFYDDDDIVQGDKVCHNIFCGNGPNSDSCSIAMPTEGMVCDIGKRCNQGYCVMAPSDFPTPTNLLKDCIYGDTKRINFKNKRTTCSEFIKDNGLDSCYNKLIHDHCCVECPSQKHTTVDCEYGDKNKQCAEYEPDQICESNAKVCCHTCRNWVNPVGKRSDDSPLTEVILEEQELDLQLTYVTVDEGIEMEIFIEN